ncbi:MAG: CDP-alcohol phosphatidyltransferase family protein [Treponema sp.]|jgi:phosphatidylglycerophosphate synthase|nr:CDP-alcohol phosphatidyltransferase family protein [Treponema sp.]
MNLKKSLIITLSVLFSLQSAGFLVITALWALPSVHFYGFLAGQMLFFTVILCFLLKNQRFFYRIKTGERETFVNAANKLTLFRITMLPFLIFLTLASYHHGAGPVLSAAAALAFISDFFDGRISRKAGLESYMGKILDSASDYMLLGTIAAVFCYFRLLPLWLFLLIAGRLLFNGLVMLALFLILKKLHPQTTPFGKTAIAAIMILLVMEAAKPLGLPFWIRYIEFAAGSLIAASVIDKILFFFRTLRGAARTKTVSGGVSEVYATKSPALEKAVKPVKTA